MLMLFARLDASVSRAQCRSGVEWSEWLLHTVLSCAMPVHAPLFAPHLQLHRRQECQLAAVQMLALPPAAFCKQTWWPLGNHSVALLWQHRGLLDIRPHDFAVPPHLAGILLLSGATSTAAPHPLQPRPAAAPPCCSSPPDHTALSGQRGACERSAAGFKVTAVGCNLTGSGWHRQRARPLHPPWARQETLRFHFGVMHPRRWRSSMFSWVRTAWWPCRT